MPNMYRQPSKFYDDILLNSVFHQNLYIPESSSFWLALMNFSLLKFCNYNFHELFVIFNNCHKKEMSKFKFGQKLYFC